MRAYSVTVPDRQVSPALAEAAYDLLVEMAAASPGADARRDFLRSALRPGGCEYRFQGSLGFGGKYRDEGEGAPYVSCYPEDRNASRDATLAAVNSRLGELFAGAA